MDSENTFYSVAMQSRIQRGVALLDEVKPGWEERINLTTFRIANGRFCVLGQLFGTYVIGLYTLNRKWPGINSEEHGFMWDSLTDAFGLQHAWVDTIKSRKTIIKAGEENGCGDDPESLTLS